MRRCPECKTEYEDKVSFCGQDGTITIQVQPPDDHDPRLGQKLGEYITAARVADGAMGRVYEGRHPETKERVAIKVLHPEVAKDAVAVERFKREFETAEEFDHPNIVNVLEFGETGDGSFFLTMEYLEGSELSLALREDGPMQPARALRILCQLSAGLDHAHSFGVIHRDLKPDNVFLTRGDIGEEVRILDFGSVKLQMETGPKLTAIGTTLGSPYYMSPEQAMGKQDVDQRTDVFSVAAIAWEVATAKVAFEGSSVAEILMKIVNTDPHPPSDLAPDYPPRFDVAVLKGVHKDKTKRPRSTGEFADELVRAFGLEADHSKWAKVSLDQIQEALDGATPMGPPSVAPPPQAPPAAALPPDPRVPSLDDPARETLPMRNPAPAMPSAQSMRPVLPPSNRGAWIGVAVLFVVLVSIAAAYALSR